MGKQFCPSCGSEDIEMDDEGFLCTNCGYRGEFPEKHLLIADEEDEEEPVIKPKKAVKAVKVAKTVKKAAKKAVRRKKSR